MAKGLIHVYTGDGKGKTTSAFGLAMRAAGHGKKVLILQFLKSRTKDAGERTIAKKSGIKVIKFKGQTTPLFDPTVKSSELKRHIKKAISFSVNQIKSGTYDLIIMDEFNNLFRDKYATAEDIKKILREQPEGVELVFTGRGAPKELIAIAEYVTEMRMIKHPSAIGIKARKGIEF
ncbi:MAG: cob(I)yrinic acid a,c-diamide adenosyltransferase [Nitrospirae bacterium]|nr:cob(I)yrinic acid a,c-diamide adenosyltransferase [Nitrospirota bacterium]